MTARPPRFLAILPILPMDLRRMIQARWTPADVATLLLVSKSWSENVLLLKALLAAANKKMEEPAPRLLPRPVHEYMNYCNYCRAGEAPTHWGGGMGYDGEPENNYVDGPWLPNGSRKPRCMNCESQSEGHCDKGDPYVAIAMYGEGGLYSSDEDT